MTKFIRIDGGAMIGDAVPANRTIRNAEKTAMQTIQAPSPQHDARDLVAGGATAQLLLDGQVYTLRITRANKLILTK